MIFLVNGNSPTLKFDNFSHFQNVISNNLFPQPANVIMTLKDRSPDKSDYMF